MTNGKMKKNLIFKILGIFALFLTISSCNLIDNTDDKIITKWTDVNSYFEIVFFPKINYLTKQQPDISEISEAYLKVKEFHQIMLEQRRNLDSNLSYIYSSNEERITNIIDTTSQISKVLDFLHESRNKLSDIESFQLYSQLHIQMSQLSDEMVLLEYNWSKTFQESIFAFIKYFMILIIFIAIFAAALITLTIIESKNKDKKIQESSDYLRYILLAQEEERNRISRDLHDTIAQDMRYTLSLIGALPDSEDSRLILEKQKLCINQIRNLCYNMAPPDIDNKDLAASLETLCGKFMQESLIETRLTITDDVDFSHFDSEKMLNIYRIIQESLSNIQKHANATEATILFRNTDVTDLEGETEQKLLMIISDDGEGIDSKLLNKINNEQITFSVKGHFGVRSIKERVHLLEGSVIFNSYPDCGTEVRILLPY